MLKRSELLREMGLAPLWRLRSAGAATRADPDLYDVAATGTVTIDTKATGAVATGAVAAGTVATNAREARIAALDLDAVVSDIAECTACALCRTRHRTVPGIGDPHARWLFVGEAPGADEDARGEPFVGRAGRLLDNMLAALGLERGRDVYIANVLKCRPPGNRTPAPLEVAACRPYLDRQIELIAPTLIVALGKVSAAALLGTDQPVGAMRGRLHRYRGTALVVTYHPAYLLRSATEKARAWEDLLFARRKLRELAEAAGAGLALPAARPHIAHGPDRSTGVLGG